MEISFGTVFHDAFGGENLFMLDDFNEKNSGFSGYKLNFTLTVPSEKWLLIYRKKIIERFPLNAEFAYQRVNYKRCRRDGNSSIALAFDQMFPK